MRAGKSKVSRAGTETRRAALGGHAPGAVVSCAPGTLREALLSGCCDCRLWPAERRIPLLVSPLEAPRCPTGTRRDTLTDTAAQEGRTQGLQGPVRAVLSLQRAFVALRRRALKGPSCGTHTHAGTHTTSQAGRQTCRYPHPQAWRRRSALTLERQAEFINAPIHPPSVPYAHLWRVCVCRHVGRWSGSCLDAQAPG